MERLESDRLAVQESSRALARYRGDVDGLRGIAVLAVLGYHLGVSGFRGGYTGVDVFFVISGYVVTGLLMTLGHAPGTLLTFYERRVRRLLPALLLVATCSLIAGWVLLLPHQLQRFSFSLLATHAFASNLFFWRGAGYFAEPTELDPLLHTWSLAVEGQFYLVYPMILGWALRRERRARVTVACLAVASLLACIWLTQRSPNSAFYLLPTRVWEFMLGALLALGGVPSIRQRVHGELTAALGLLMIVLSVVWFDSSVAFPGLAALLPCLGAALVIHGGGAHPTGVGRVLGSRPLVGVGLISYSLYLWHWPIISFSSQYSGSTQISPWHALWVFAVSVGLSVLSWRFVERPFRNVQRISRKVVSMALGALGLLTTSVAVALVISRGAPQRLSPEASALAKGAFAFEPRRDLCLSPDTHFADERCRLGAPGASQPSFVLWGDSHAAALMPSIDAAAERLGLSGVFIGRNSCPPLLEVEIWNGPEGAACGEHNVAVWAHLAELPDLRSVFLAARWARYVQGTPYGQETGPPFLLANRSARATHVEQNPRFFEAALERTVEELTGRGLQPVLVGPVPEVGVHVPWFLAVGQMRQIERRASPTRSAFETRQSSVLDALARLNGSGISTVYPHHILCDTEQCTTRRGLEVLYVDDDHLSVLGAEMLVDLFEPALAPLVRR